MRGKLGLDLVERRVDHTHRNMYVGISIFYRERGNLDRLGLLRLMSCLAGQVR